MMVGSTSRRLKTHRWLSRALVTSLWGLGGLALVSGTGCSSKSGGSDGSTNQDMSAGVDGRSGLNESVVQLNNMMGINFDDFIYSSSLKSVVVPGALTGNLFLIDVSTGAVSTISGFDNTIPDGGMMFNPPDGFMLPDGFRIPDGGFRFFGEGGLTSVTEGNSLLYTTDRSNNSVYVVDPAGMTIVGSPVALQSAPDVIRYVATTNELWVTEPRGKNSQIEILSLSADGKTVTPNVAKIAVTNGPESLYIDNTNKVAFTNQNSRPMMMGAAGTSSTEVIDLVGRTSKGVWANGCQDGAGFAEDVTNNLLFVACGENGAVSVDISNLAAGTMVSQIRNASQPNLIAFSSTLRHLYVPGPSTSIVSVGKTGTLTNLGGAPTPYAEDSTVIDENGNFWNAQQYNGSFLRVMDPLPASNMP